MTAATDTTEASAILRDLSKLERLALVAARKMSARIRQAARVAVNLGREPQILIPMQQAIAPLLADAMTAAHLTALRREAFHAQSKMQPAGLRLSVFDAVLERLGRQLSANIPALRRQYDAPALQIVTGVSDKAERELRKTVFDLIGKGAHVREAVDVLNDKFDSLGLSPRSDFNLETIFRTQTQLAYGAGRYQADQRPAVQSILWGYRYSTAGDDRVRPSHAELDGVTLPKEHPFWQTCWPPNGWNCRCSVIPFFDEQPIVEPPAGAHADKGFGFNPGNVFGARGTDGAALSLLLSLA